MIGIVWNGPPTTCAFDNIVSCAGGGGGGSADPSPPPPPAGCKKQSLSSYLPTKVYSGGKCPAGKLITVCYNSERYSLSGRFGSPGRDKLQNSNNFGNGPIKYRVTVKNIGRNIAVSTLTNAGCDIFQMGLNERDAGGRLYGVLPSSSVNALKQWAASSPSRVLLGSQSYPSVLRTGYFTSKR